MAHLEQSRMVEQQKQQCPFCKIIAGEIPSSKIFESDTTDLSQGVLAVLDINPAAEGHVLVMPREHYPILPLIPPDTFKELFSTIVKIADIEKILFLKQGTTIFVANGAAAGQQSSHFMAHVIARDPSELTQFDLFENDADEEKLKELHKTLSHNLPIMLKQAYNNFPLRDSNGNPLPLKQTYTKEHVINIIEQNPQLKDALIQEPKEFKKAIPLNDQLKTIFADVDVDEVISHFVKDFAKEKTIDVEVIDSFDKAVDFVNDNPKLKELIINNPEKFRKEFPESEKLKKIFNDINIDKLVDHFQPKEEPPEPPKKEKNKDKPDLDTISKLF